MYIEVNKCKIVGFQQTAIWFTMLCIIGRSFRISEQHPDSIFGE